MPWRLRWLFSEALSRWSWRRNRELLCNPGTYYFALILKLIEGVYSKPVNLKLRGGFTIPLRHFMTAYIYQEIFVNGCYDIQLPSKPHILDVGANTGLFALRMKQQYPNASIQCFEPEPSNFQQLEALIASNRLSDVTPVRKAIAARAGTAPLYLHNSNIGGHSLHGKGWSIPVELVTLADFVGERCDLLKLDIEGAEYDIIMALDASLASRIQRIIYEPMADRFNIQEVNQHLESLGYQAVVRKGLVFASKHRC